MKKRVNPWNVLQYGLLCVWIGISVITLGWFIVSSFKSNSELFVNIWDFPEKLQIENYVRAWTSGRMAVYFKNTLIIQIAALTLLTVFGSMAGYVLARFKRFRWVSLASLLFISGMAIPAQITLVPLYLMYSQVGLLNTRLGIILVYCAVYMPFTVFVLTGFFSTIPREVEEAAAIDGCSKWRVFLHVAVPMAKPGITTVVIFNFLSIWNEYFYAMMLITDDAKMPLSAGLYNLKSQQQMSMDWAALFAGVVILVIPTLIVFFLLQDKIEKGVTAGAVKG